jgi:lipopolysaccharide export system protein LptA
VEVEWEWAVVERTLTHRSIQDNILVFQGDLVVFSGPAEAFADGVVILLKAAETVRAKLRTPSKGENE